MVDCRAVLLNRLSGDVAVPNVNQCWPGAAVCCRQQIVVCGGYEYVMDTETDVQRTANGCGAGNSKYGVQPARAIRNVRHHWRHDLRLLCVARAGSEGK